MVWVGLLIGLLSALVANLSELKYPKNTKPWSYPFFRRNRFKVALTGLAVLGFIAAALTLRQDHTQSEAAERNLRYQNDVLKALMLSNKRVSPLVRIVIGTDSPLDTVPALTELAEWMDGGPAAALPKPIGFVPSLVRAEIFRGAQPQAILKTESETAAIPSALQRLGYVDLRASEDRLRFQFSVGTDGSALWARPGARLQGLETSVYELPNHKRAVVFEFTVSDPLEALELFHSFDRSYEQGSSLLVLRVATPSCHARDVRAQQRMARVSASLDDHAEVLVTASLEEATPQCESDGATDYEWHFKEPPELVVSMPGGLK